MRRLLKFAVFGYVLLWTAFVMILSIAQERLLNLPRIIGQGIGMFLGTLAFYPLAKCWKLSAASLRSFNGRY